MECHSRLLFHAAPIFCLFLDLSLLENNRSEVGEISAIYSDQNLPPSRPPEIVGLGSANPIPKNGRNIEVTDGKNRLPRIMYTWAMRKTLVG